MAPPWSSEGRTGSGRDITLGLLPRSGVAATPHSGRGREGGAELLDSLRDHRPVDPLAGLLADDEPGLGEDLGVVADRGLTLADRIDEVAGAFRPRRSDHR